MGRRKIPSAPIGSVMGATIAKHEAALHALAREHAEADRKANILDDARLEAERRYFAACPPPPVKARVWSDTARRWIRLTESHIDKLVDAPLYADVFSKEVWQADQDACKRIADETGFTAALAAYDAARKAEHGLLDRIIATPAHTIAGLAVKMRVLYGLYDLPVETDPSKWTYDDRLFLSLSNDIHRAYVPMGPAAVSEPFNPAVWLAEAEHVGYRVYLVPSERHPSGYGLMFENPEVRRRGSASDDLWLWHWLRPNDDERRTNEAALRRHLLAIGRVGYEHGRPAKGGVNDKV